MNHKVLVVDNDYFFVTFMAELLTARGYEVVKAYDGKDGIQAFETNDIRLMFVDLVMPKVDGWQFIRYIRSKYPDYGYPVITVSGIIIEQLDTLDQIGADYYIAKGPLPKLKTLLNAFLDRTENRPFPDEAASRIFDLGHLYPRREAVELIESLHFQQAITENIGMGILVVDTDTKILNTNSRALEILALTEAAVLNRPLPGFFAARDQARLLQSMKDVARDRDLDQINLSLSVNNRRIRLVITALFPKKTAGGWIVAMEDRDPREAAV